VKIVILAAGMGTRLGTLIPKPLTSLKDEKTILDYQVQTLEKIVGIDNIVIIVGYKKELIMEKVPDATFVYNAAYAHNNTGKSLLTALRKIDEDAIWMNGDVFFEKEAIELIKDSQHSAVLVDTKKCSDEEIKYTLNKAGNIVELSKVVKNGKGEAVGINFVKREDLPAFRTALEAIEKQDYFEKALENLTLKKQLVLKPVYLGDVYCKEIDFPEDLEEVQGYCRGKGCL
jgi:choline kinase